MGEAFAGAACALFTLLAEDLSAVRSDVEERVECEADALDTLLVAFLNELIFRWGSRRLVFGNFEVAVSPRESGGFRCSAVARGERLNGARHVSTVEPKGATFTELRVAEDAAGWVAQCVVDV